MITSVFKKSTPINYSLLIILMLFFYFFYQTQGERWINEPIEIGKKVIQILLLFGSLFISNFIVKKNALTKDSVYSSLFFIILLLFFPSVLNNLNLILANFFILLAMRRLVSLQTLKAPKEKIFDASLWIFVASLFQFWSVLYIILVYVSIIFHVSRDYRNWLLPFVSLLTTSIIFVFYTLLLDNTAIDFYLNSQNVSYSIDYFTNDFQNLALSIYAIFIVFFAVPYFFSLSHKPLNLQASYKKIIAAFFVGIIIFVISPNKSNDLLIFTFMPLSIMATNTIEYTKSKIQQEIILFVAIVLGMTTYFTQL